MLETETLKAQCFRGRHKYDLEAPGLSRERILADFRDIAVELGP